MSDERSPEFQAAVAKLQTQRDRPRAWDVFRDWALSEGYARGELMALDSELESARARRAPGGGLERERASLFAAHRAQFLGRDELLGDLQLTWKRGFVARAVVPNAGVHLDCLRELATHPSGCFLESLECSPRELRAFLEAGPSELRALILRAPALQPDELNFDGAAGRRRPRDPFEPVAPRDDLAELTRALPSLEELTLQAPIALDVARFGSARLTELVFASARGAELELGDTTSILDRCPAVVRFAPSSSAPASLRVVRERRLQTLELEGFTDETARALEDSPLHIGTLDLRSIEFWTRPEEVVARWLGTRPRVRRVLVPRGASKTLRERVKRFNESH